jgi:hypothetical protein
MNSGWANDRIGVRDGEKEVVPADNFVSDVAQEVDEGPADVDDGIAVQSWVRPHHGRAGDLEGSDKGLPLCWKGATRSSALCWSACMVSLMDKELLRVTGRMVWLSRAGSGAIANRSLRDAGLRP